MITGFLKMLAGVWAFLGRCLAAIGIWLREPHDWWRITCFGLALLCTFAAFAAYDARQTIVLVRTKAEAAGIQCAADKGVLAFNAAGGKAALDAITRTLEDKAKELKALHDLNASLAAQNAVLAARAEKDHELFMAENARRPSSCTAALKVLQQTCPTLGGY